MANRTNRGFERDATYSTIKRVVDGSFQWSVTEDGPDGPEVTLYSTNEHGHGLWQNGVQLRGTSQFNLADCSASTRRRRVARFMSGD